MTRHGPTRTHTDLHGRWRGCRRRSVSVCVCPCLSVQAAGGFTLLELLVAMTLMVAVASSLYTALYTGFRAHRSALRAVEPTSQAINAIELLKQDILGVLPPGSGLAGSFIGTDATGSKGVDSDSLEFYTTHIYPDDEQVTGGLGKIELLLEEDTESNRGDFRSYQLVRRITTNLLAPRDVDPVEQVLCRNVTALNFRYHDGESWLEDWDSTADANSLPRAVEIDIQIAYFGRNAKSDTSGRSIARSSEKEPEKRRLIQSFAIACEAAEETSTEEASAETTTGGATAGGGAR